MVRLTAGKEEIKSSLFHFRHLQGEPRPLPPTSLAKSSSTHGTGPVCLFSGISRWQHQRELEVFTKGVTRLGNDFSGDFVGAFSRDSVGPNSNRQDAWWSSFLATFGLVVQLMKS